MKNNCDPCETTNFFVLLPNWQFQPYASAALLLDQSLLYPLFMRMRTENNRTKNAADFGLAWNVAIFNRMSADIGIFGLSARAVNLAVNLATKEVNVAVGHRSSDLVRGSFSASRLVKGVLPHCGEEGRGGENHNDKRCEWAAIRTEPLVFRVLRIPELPQASHPHGETRLERGKELF